MRTDRVLLRRWGLLDAGLNIETAEEPAGVAGQDRVAVVAIAGGAVVVVADGAGNSARGALTAEAVVAGVRGAAAVGGEPADWLMECDRRLLASGGETTGVVVVVRGGIVSGASVGDSEAWLQRGGTWIELTGEQRRKPLIGSGRAVPIAFGPLPMGERVLIASDGLVRHAPVHVVREVASVADDRRMRRLLDAARLASGCLPDDVAIAVIEGGSGDAQARGATS